MSHPFDEAIALTWQGADLFTGRTHPVWANMVGPYGGITAASCMQAVLQHPQCLGEPVALTLNFAAALVDGTFELVARPVRTNRSSQHWVLELRQSIEGAAQVMLTGTAITAVRRPTWQAQDCDLPQVAAPESLPRTVMFEQVQWMHCYDMRVVSGPVPEVQDGRDLDSLTQFWMRDQAGRPLDGPALTAMADAFYPRIWRRRARWVPAGTVSMTVYFHASGEQLAAVGSDFLFGQARAQDFRLGFFDQSAQLWSRAGLLLASTHQIVYYKE